MQISGWQTITSHQSAKFFKLIFVNIKGSRESNTSGQAQLTRGLSMTAEIKVTFQWVQPSD